MTLKLVPVELTPVKLDLDNLEQYIGATVTYHNHRKKVISRITTSQFHYKIYGTENNAYTEHNKQSGLHREGLIIPDWNIVSIELPSKGKE